LPLVEGRTIKIESLTGIECENDSLGGEGTGHPSARYLLFSVKRKGRTKGGEDFHAGWMTRQKMRTAIRQSSSKKSRWESRTRQKKESEGVSMPKNHEIGKMKSLGRNNFE